MKKFSALTEAIVKRSCVVYPQVHRRYMLGSETSEELIFSELLFYFALLLHGTLNEKPVRASRKKAKSISQFAVKFLSYLWHSHHPDHRVSDSEFLGLLRRIKKKNLINLIIGIGDMSRTFFLLKLCQTYCNISYKSKSGIELNGLYEPVEEFMLDRIKSLHQSAYHPKGKMIREFSDLHRFGKEFLALALLVIISGLVLGSIPLAVSILVFGGKYLSNRHVIEKAKSMDESMVDSKELCVYVVSANRIFIDDASEESLDPNHSSDDAQLPKVDQAKKTEDVPNERENPAYDTANSNPKTVKRRVGRQSGGRQLKRSRLREELKKAPQQSVKLSLEFPAQCLATLRLHYAGLSVFQIISRSGYKVPNLYAAWAVKKAHALKAIFEEGKGQLVAPHGESGIKMSQGKFWVKGNTKERAFAKTHEVMTSHSGLATVIVFYMVARKNKEMYGRKLRVEKYDLATCKPYSTR